MDAQREHVNFLPKLFPLTESHNIKYNHLKKWTKLNIFNNGYYLKSLHGVINFLEGLLFSCNQHNVYVLYAARTRFDLRGLINHFRFVINLVLYINYLLHP